MPSESPKWIALVLSLIAIIISGLSWWESHTGRRINEEVNRPILTLIDFSSPSVSQGKDHLSVKINYTFRNVGKVAATARVVTIQSTPTLRTFCHILLSEKESERHVYFEPLPGLDRTISEQLEVSQDCEEDGKLILDNIMMIVEYSDPVSGNLFSQVFTPKLELNLKERAGAPTPGQ